MTEFPSLYFKILVRIETKFYQIPWGNTFIIQTNSTKAVIVFTRGNVRTYIEDLVYQASECDTNLTLSSNLLINDVSEVESVERNEDEI